VKICASGGANDMIYTSTYVCWHSFLNNQQVTHISLDIKPTAEDWLVVWQPVTQDEFNKVMAVINRFEYSKRVLIHYEGRYKRPYGYSVRYQQQFGRIYTNCSTDVDGDTVKYFPVPVWIKPITTVMKREKLICSVVTNHNCNREPRHQATSRLQNLGMDVYGANNKPVLGDTPTSRSYAAKLMVMSQYKFAFACENQLDLGHLTEKPFDALSAGCILVYLGPLDTPLFIPENCYINYRDFWSESELMAYIKNMSCNEISKYQSAILQARDILVNMRTFESCVRYVCKDLGFDCESPYHTQLIELTNFVASKNTI
jgi:hypothetical protein